MKKCGIYCLFHALTNKRYIGQSVDMAQRKREHFSELNRGIHPNAYLQNLAKKYGVNSFEFRVLEEVTEGMLDVKEAEWIKFYHTTDRILGCNLQTGGKLHKHHSPETRRKIGDGNRGKFVPDSVGKKISVALQGNSNSLGHVESEENKEKHRLFMTGKQYALGCNPSPESRLRMSLASRGKPKSEETRTKMRASRIQYLQSLPMAHNQLASINPELN